jgi:hypothetical protein
MIFGILFKLVYGTIMAANNYKNSEFAGQSHGKVVFHCTTLFCNGEGLLAAVHQLCSNFT